MKKTIRLPLSLLVATANLLAQFPTHANAGIVDSIKAMRPGISAMVERVTKSGKLGTMVTYRDAVTGATKQKIFWGQITPDEMAKYNPKAVSNELKSVSKELELAQGYVSNKSSAQKALTALADGDALPDITKFQLQDKAQLRQVERLLEEQGIVIPKPKLSATASAAEIKAAEEAYANSIIKAYPHAKQRLTGKAHKANLFVESFKKFPMDAASFFVALGAMSTWDLVFNYNTNPVAYDQFLDGQKDPVGLFSFYAFMVANGAATGAISKVLFDVTNDKKNKAFRPFLPYFGMTFGMAASHIVTEVAHFPFLKECAADMVMNKGSESENCQKSFAHWTTEFSGKETLSNFAPALGSMWASTLASGLVSAGANGVTSYVTGKVFHITEINISRVLVPAKFAVRLGGISVQTALFLGFDKLFNPMVVAPWKNTFDGGYIGKLDTNITNILSDYSKTGWKASGIKECEEFMNKDKECATDIVYNLKKLQQRLSNWRQFNMEDVLMQHGNWQQMVIPATTMMYASESFYNQFLQAVADGKSGTLGEKLYRAYPLYGIKSGNENIDNNLRPLFEKHEEILIPAQLKKIEKVSTWMDSTAFKNLVAYKGLTEKDLNFLNGLQAIMKNTTAKNLEPIGMKLREVNNILGKQNDYPEQAIANFVDSRVTYSNNLRALLKAIHGFLGNPRPLMYQGEAFTVMYEEDSEFKQSIEALQWGWGEKMLSGGPNSLLDNVQIATLSYKRPTELMLSHMAFGTDVSKNQDMFRDAKIMRNFLGGMPALFSAPKVTKNFDFGGVPMQPFNTNIFNKEYNISGSKMTIWELLRIKENFSPEIMGEDKFADWWDNHVKKDQYMTAWTQWEKEYLAIMPKLIKRLWRKDEVKETKAGIVSQIFDRGMDLNFWDGARKENNDTVFNKSPVSNGIMEELAQERKLYMLILGEVLKSAGLKLEEGNTHSFTWKNAVKVEAPNSLLTYLRTSPGLNLTDFNNQAKAQSQFANFKFQGELTREFYGMDSLLAGLKVKKTEDNNFKADEYKVYSKVSNKSFEDQRAKIEEILKAVESQMESMTLNDVQKKTATIALGGIRAVADQIKSYGEIINAVSYQEVKGDDGKSIYEKPACTQMKKSSSATDRSKQVVCQ